MSLRRSAPPGPVRVAPVPADHVYVRHLTAPGTELPAAPDGPWRPSPLLEPAGLRARAADVDVVHLHFGFEHRTPAQLAEWVGLLAVLGIPLVLTVHDLVNPHLADQRPYAEALDVLVPAADRVLTLTAGAAAEIARRWGRVAVVAPHPHVVPLARMARPRPVHDGFTVGLLAKARANNAAEVVRAELTTAVAGLPGARLVPWPEQRPDDDALWDHLAGLDVLVLPYRSATHSGFVEACHDLGTTVVAARTGHLAEQQPIVGFDLGRPGSLTAALAAARGGRTHRGDPRARAEQRVVLAALHARVYDQALAAGAAQAAGPAA